MQSEGFEQSENVPELPDELNQFVRQLQTFVPRSPSSDRDLLLFRAGETAARMEFDRQIAAGHRKLRYWQAATSACLIALVGIGSAWNQMDDKRVIAERRGDATNDSDAAASRSAAATGPVESTDQSIVEMSPPLVFEITPENRALFDEIFQGGTLHPSKPSTPVPQSEHALLNAREPVLTMRSLMPGERSAFSIQQLIKEPSL